MGNLKVDKEVSQNNISNKLDDVGFMTVECT